MKATAVKRGRDPRWPYIPVVVRENGTTHNCNSKKAFATREEAIAFAQQWIDYALSQWAIMEEHRAGRRQVKY